MNKEFQKQNTSALIQGQDLRVGIVCEKQFHQIFSQFASQRCILAAEKNTLDIDAQQLAGPTTDLYLDQRNRNVLFLNRLFSSHMQLGNKCAVRSISALFFFLFKSLCLSVPPSLFIFPLLTHSTSFVLSPCYAPSLDSVRSPSHVFVIFVSRAGSLFHCFSLSSAFSYFPSQAVFPPLRSPFLLQSRWALTPRYSPSSSAAASELSRAHLPQEQP